MTGVIRSPRARAGNAEIENIRHDVRGSFRRNAARVDPGERYIWRGKGADHIVVELLSND